MKKLLVLLIVAMFSFSTYAQDGMRLGVSAGLPVGDLDEGYTFSLAGDLGFLWGISDNFSAGLMTGVAHYFGEDVEAGGFTFEFQDVTFVPIAASARFMASDKFKLGADLGYAVGISEDTDGGFYYAPRAHYAISETLDIVLSYRGISIDGSSGNVIALGLEFGI